WHPAGFKFATMQRAGCSRTGALAKNLELRQISRVKLIKIFPEDLADMSRKKLVLLIALTVAASAIAGGIVYAQEASSSKADSWNVLLEEMAQEPQEPSTRNFSFFVDGGAFLGVGTEDVSRDNMARYGMREVRGVGVTEVSKDS